MTAPIVIIDADAQFGTDLQELLERCGYPSTRTEKLAEGMGLIETSRPPLVIVGPLADKNVSFELCDQVRKMFPKIDVAIIFGFGQGDAERTKAHRESSTAALVYLEQPIRGGAFLSALKAVLDVTEDDIDGATFERILGGSPLGGLSDQASDNALETQSDKTGGAFFSESERSAIESQTADALELTVPAKEKLEHAETAPHATIDPQGNLGGTSWFYGVAGQSHGPIDERQVAQLIIDGSIKADTPVWRKGMAGWDSALACGLMSLRLQAPAGPSAGESTNDVEAEIHELDDDSLSELQLDELDEDSLGELHLEALDEESDGTEKANTTHTEHAGEERYEEVGPSESTQGRAQAKRSSLSDDEGMGLLVPEDEEVDGQPHAISVADAALTNEQQDNDADLDSLSEMDLSDLDDDSIDESQSDNSQSPEESGASTNGLKEGQGAGLDSIDDDSLGELDLEELDDDAISEASLDDIAISEASIDDDSLSEMDLDELNEDSLSELNIESIDADSLSVSDLRALDEASIDGIKDIVVGDGTTTESSQTVEPEQHVHGVEAAAEARGITIKAFSTEITTTEMPKYEALSALEKSRQDKKQPPSEGLESAVDNAPADTDGVPFTSHIDAASEKASARSELDESLELHIDDLEIVAEFDEPGSPSDAEETVSKAKDDGASGEAALARLENDPAIIADDSMEAIPETHQEEELEKAPVSAAETQDSGNASVNASETDAPAIDEPDSDGESDSTATHSQPESVNPLDPDDAVLVVSHGRPAEDAIESETSAVDDHSTAEPITDIDTGDELELISNVTIESIESAPVAQANLTKAPGLNEGAPASKPASDIVDNAQGDGVELVIESEEAMTAAEDGSEGILDFAADDVDPSELEPISMRREPLDGSGLPVGLRDSISVEIDGEEYFEIDDDSVVGSVDLSPENVVHTSDILEERTVGASREELLGLQQSLKLAQENIARQADEIDLRRGDEKTLRNEIESLRAEQAASQAEIQSLKRALDSEVGGRKADREALEVGRTEYETQTVRAEKLEEQLQHEQKLKAAIEEDLQVQRQRAEDLESRLEKARDEAEKTYSEIEDTQTKASEKAKVIREEHLERERQLKDDMGKLSDQLEGLRTEHHALQERMTASEAELESVRSEIADQKAQHNETLEVQNRKSQEDLENAQRIAAEEQERIRADFAKRLADLEATLDEKEKVLESTRKHLDAQTSQAGEQFDARELAHQEALAALESSHAQALSELVSSHESRQEAWTSEQSKAMEALSNQHSAELDALKESHGNEINRIKAEATEKDERQKAEHLAEVLSLQREHSRLIETREMDLKGRESAALEELAKEHRAVLDGLQTQHAEALEQLKAEHNEEKTAAEAQHLSAVEKLKAEHTTASEATDAVHGAAIETLEKRLAEQAAAASEAQAAALVAQEEDAQQALETLKTAHQEALDTQVAEHKASLEAVRAEHAQKVGALTRENASAFEALEHQHLQERERIEKTLSDQLNLRTEELETKIAEAEKAHRNKVDALESQHAETMGAAEKAHSKALEDAAQAKAEQLEALTNEHAEKTLTLESELSATKKELGAEVERLEERAAQLQTTSEAAESARAKVQTELEATQSELETVRFTLEKTREDLDGKSRALEARQEELEITRQEVEGLERELKNSENARKDAAIEFEARVHDIKTEFALNQEQLEGLERAVEGLNRQLAEREKDLGETREQLASITDEKDALATEVRRWAKRFNAQGANLEKLRTALVVARTFAEEILSEPEYEDSNKDSTAAQSSSQEGKESSTSSTAEEES